VKRSAKPRAAQSEAAFEALSPGAQRALDPIDRGEYLLPSPSSQAPEDLPGREAQVPDLCPRQDSVLARRHPQTLDLDRTLPRTFETLNVLDMRRNPLMLPRRGQRPGHQREDGTGGVIGLKHHVIQGHDCDAERSPAEDLIQHLERAAVDESRVRACFDRHGVHRGSARGQLAAVSDDHRERVRSGWPIRTSASSLRSRYRSAAAPSRSAGPLTRPRPEAQRLA